MLKFLFLFLVLANFALASEKYSDFCTEEHWVNGVLTGKTIQKFNEKKQKVEIETTFTRDNAVQNSKTTFTYNNEGKVSHEENAVTFPKVGTIVTTIDYRYYDGHLFERTEKIKTDQGVITSATSYGYDEAAQLIEEEEITSSPHDKDGPTTWFTEHFYKNGKEIKQNRYLQRNPNKDRELTSNKEFEYDTRGRLKFSVQKLYHVNKTPVVFDTLEEYFDEYDTAGHLVKKRAESFNPNKKHTYHDDLQWKYDDAGNLSEVLHYRTLYNWRGKGKDEINHYRKIYTYECWK